MSSQLQGEGQRPLFTLGGVRSCRQARQCQFEFVSVRPDRGHSPLQILGPGFTEGIEETTCP